MWFHNDAHKKMMEELKEKHSDITFRTIQCKDETITILYIRQLTSRECLANFVIRPLMEYCRTAKRALKASEAIDSVLYADECFLGQEVADVERHILGGETVILFSGEKEYAVVNLKQVEHRPVSDPEMTYNQRGPRDSFVENIDVNLSLLRYRLKDGSLRVEHLNVGQRTRTRIAMVFIEDIANDTAVQEMRKRLYSIDTDGFLESGELQACLMNNKLSPFPQMIVIERPDMAAEKLLEGKVMLIVDGSPYAIAAPVTFVEFMYACDDRYESKYMGLFMRLLRYMAFFISFSASSYWVAIVAFHSDVLPAGFIIAVAQARSKVPFGALVGVLLLEFIVELIRESLIRVPTKIGSAIAIVGALIIGQASIAAGIFSPLLLIIVSVEFLASFAVPYQSAANPFRWIKILLLIATSMFGFYGYVLGITVVVAEMVSINSFGVPYLAPFGPFNMYDFLRTFLFSKTVSPKRQQYMRNKDDTRTGT